MLNFLFRVAVATMTFTARVAWFALKLAAGLLALAADGEMSSHALRMGPDEYRRRHPFDEKGFWARARGE